MKNSIENTAAYITRDQSEIRELLHPSQHPVKNQSLAEARVSPGQVTSRHYHEKTEEIYFILEGSGQMFLDDESFDVQRGDSILIKPGQHHCIKNTGQQVLHFLCSCAPAYQHEDSFLID